MQTHSSLDFFLTNLNSLGDVLKSDGGQRRLICKLFCKKKEKHTKKNTNATQNVICTALILCDLIRISLQLNSTSSFGAEELHRPDFLIHASQRTTPKRTQQGSSQTH